MEQTPAYDIFISYRREGGAATALFLREKLTHCGMRVFLDVSDLHRGYFDEALLKHIEEAPNFLVILSRDSLERCVQEDDWLRKEIAQAIRTKRNIIPLLMEGFQFPARLPEEIQTLPRHQGVTYSHLYHEAMVASILQSIGDNWKAAGTAQLAATRGRVLDAAMPKQVPVGKPAELTAMIRRTDSKGLKAVLEIEESDARPEDVRSRPFELEFPADAMGRPLPAEVTLRVDAPDFEPRVQTKKLRVPVNADSESYAFLMTPRFTGDLRVNLELSQGDVCLASRVLRTNGEPSDRVVSDAKVLVSLPILVRSIPGAERATPAAAASAARASEIAAMRVPEPPQQTMAAPTPSTAPTMREPPPAPRTERNIPRNMRPPEPPVAVGSAGPPSAPYIPSAPRDAAAAPRQRSRPGLWVGIAAVAVMGIVGGGIYLNRPAPVSTGASVPVDAGSGVTTGSPPLNARPHPPKASGEVRRLETLSTQLNARARTVTRNLGIIQQQQSGQGYSLRPDILASERRMQLDLARGDAALRARDLANAQRYYRMAETEITNLERILGR